jgi:hypothetical protein
MLRQETFPNHNAQSNTSKLKDPYQGRLFFDFALGRETFTRPH